MPTAHAYATALQGLTGAVVDVEATIADDLPGFAIIGLPDHAIGEARDRIRSGALHAGTPLSHRRLTVALTPVGISNSSTSNDLAIAASALAADGVVDAASVARVAHIGEIALDGRLRPVAGVLPMVVTAARAGFDTVLVPAASLAEASLVPGIRAVGLTSLRDLAIWHGATLQPVDAEPIPLPTMTTASGADPVELSELRGYPQAVEAAIAAAAGGHHMQLLAPEGAPVRDLARAMADLLPDLDESTATDVTGIRSLAGLPVDALVRRPPFEAPHHSASAAAIVGGGAGLIRPGVSARAHGGVLFLEQAAEFSPAVLDALRQPLEAGTIAITRAAGTARFPARLQLVLASTACPCGNTGSRRECECTPFARRRYLSRLSGPLLDRMDIRVQMGTAAGTASALGPTMSTAAARERVSAARERAAARLQGTPWRVNAHVPGSWLRSPAGAVDADAAAPLDRALEQGAITLRGYDRALRVAWTLADLEGTGRPTAEQIGRALRLRRAE